METKLKRLLIATPLREGASSNYVQQLIPLIKNGVRGYDIHTLFIAGPSVNFARNEIAFYAMNEGFDELVQIDEDLMHWERYLPRLMSHDVDIVAGVYCKKKVGKPFWLFTPKPGATAQPDGLLEVTGVATGFLRTKVDVLRKMFTHNPDNKFTAKAHEGDPATVRYDWFRMGVMGKGTAKPGQAAPWVLEDATGNAKAVKAATDYLTKATADTMAAPKADTSALDAALDNLADITT